MLARYNRLANARLYDACADLGDRELKRERPAFFRSIHGTLNHILLGDRIWLARLAGGEAPSTGLDAILCDDFAELRAARVAEDARIEVMTDGLTDAGMKGTIRYFNNEGRVFEDPVDRCSPTSSTTRPITAGRCTTCSCRPM